MILKKLLKNFMLTFLFSLVLTFLLLHIFYNPVIVSYEGSNKTQLGKALVDLLFSLIFCFCLTVLSLTALLNVFKSVRQNLLFRTLSFFLLPLLLVMGTFHLFNHPNDIYPFWFSVATFFSVEIFFYLIFNNFIFN